MGSDARARLVEAYGALRRGVPGALSGAESDAVGIVGGDVPEEPLRAAGLHPFRLVGAPGAPTPIADRFVERAVDPVARSIFERLLDGTYGWLTRLVLCHDSDATVRLYHYLRELRRIEPQRELPELAFVDVLHQPARTSAAYTRQRLEGFVETVERWSGTQVDETSLRSATIAVNQRRSLLTEVAELRARSPWKLSGADALAVIGAATAMPQATYEELVRDLLDDLSRTAPPDPDPDPVRLFVTGSAHDAPGWYAAIEATPAVIVGEDHAFGNAAATGHVDEHGDPLTALTAFYQHRAAGSARSSIARRAAGTVAGATAAQADGVVCLLRKEDPAPHWDVAAQRDGLAEVGLPCHVIEVGGYLDSLAPEQQVELAGFVTGLVRHGAPEAADGVGEAREAHR